MQASGTKVDMLSVNSNGVAYHIATRELREATNTLGPDSLADDSGEAVRLVGHINTLIHLLGGNVYVATVPEVAELQEWTGKIVTSQTGIWPPVLRSSPRF
jgi:hypothetical protein